MLRTIDRCRICGNAELEPSIDLGEQALTGIFPRDKNADVSRAPLEVVKCVERGSETCGLLQLRHTYDLRELYGRHYGYRSSLNQSMVRHLQAKVQKILGLVSLSSGDLVVDIGSNDGTLLKAYPRVSGAKLVGIDPTGLSEYYPEHIQLIPDFFSTETLAAHTGGRKAKIVTSVAMFYDLEAPLDFMRSVAEVLADDGVWVFEQSYTPEMLQKTAYDTICHEHLEYYCLKQIAWMTDRAGLEILDVELNDVNGGSFSVTAAKRGSGYRLRSRREELLAREEREGLHTAAPYARFKSRVFSHRDRLRDLVERTTRAGDRILGYGASTKGNVVLQFCGFTPREIPYIAEVNQDKFGCYTPGTRIPIISEPEARAMNPDAFMVMPWHFKRGIVQRELDFLRQGKRLIMPLPEIEIIGLAEALSIVGEGSARAPSERGRP